MRFVGIDGFIDEAELQFLDVNTGEEKRICIPWDDLKKLQAEAQVALTRRAKIILEMEAAEIAKQMAEEKKER